MKRNLAVLLTAMAFLMAAPEVLATTDTQYTDETAVTTAYDITVFLNDQEVLFNEEMGFPFIDSANRTQMPFRVILEGYGAEVSWDPVNRVAKAEKDDIVVEVPIGERYIIRNTEVILIDTASLIYNDRTYIPLRAVMEAFDNNVYWNEVLRRVVIETESQPAFSRLPALYDLRNLSRLTSVKDQGEIGACWAFSTLGAIESYLLPEQMYDFSEDHMSLSHGYNLTQDEGGDFQISLAYLARWSGPVYEFEDPYGDGESPIGLKAAVHIQEALILPEKDYSAIKRAVMNYGGVQTSIHIRDIQEQEFGEAYNAASSSFLYKGITQPNHDVVIVGWDDDYGVDNFTDPPESPGAFICRNSYGDYFGDDGYFYVSYEDTWIGSESIVYSRIDSNDNYDRIYQSDWLGWVGRIGYGKDTAYFSNVYRAERYELLRAVSFYATDRDSTYRVFVVPTFAGVEDFDQMVQVAAGTFDYAGYYTVDLDEAVPVSGDYAVVVKITTPDSLFPVAAEFYKEVPWLESVDLTDGRGYMSFDGLLWESTELILESNVSLKAFTDFVEVIPSAMDDGMETFSDPMSIEELIELTDEEAAE